MNDDLSRLLAGELPPDEALALRARIAADPALAERWARMQALPGRLRALPKEIPPPKGVLLGAGAPPPQRPRSAPIREGAARRALPWLGWAAAAALAIGTLRPAPTRVLVAGTEVIEGRGEVLAGDVRVAVDGTARVTVEPPAAGGREVGAEDETMNPSHLLAALAGSIVTVTVTQGVAWLHAEDAPATRVAAGETRTVGDADPADADGARGLPRRGAADRGARTRTDDAARVAELERDVARLTREKAVATARVRQHEGQPQPWPEDAPAAHRPEAFERFLDERLADLPDAELAALDCDEFPCFAVVRDHGEAADWEDRLRPLQDAAGLEAAGFGPAAEGIGIAMESGGEDGTVRLFGFAVAPPDLDEAARRRLQFRADSALRALAEQAAVP